jgi:Arc/MetJ-type ribon-helix-helix transcriptional regulator
MRTRVTSLRLPEDQAVELAAVARAEGESVSEIVRAAVYQFIAARRSDREFKERLQKRLEEDREVLERLAG